MKTATARLPRTLLGGSDSGFNKALLFPLGLLAFMILAPLISPDRAPLGLLLQGAEAGGVNGLLALGLVLTYRANRVINFSYASMGALAGTFGLELHLGQHWNWWPSMAVGLLIGGLLGALTELLLRWRFQKVPRLVVMVATIGLAQLFSGVQVLVPGWLKGPEFLGSFNTSLSSIHFYIRPTLFNGNDLFIMAVVLLAPLAIGWFLVRTNSGIAVRSMADNPDRARLLGIPLHRISLMVWIIAGVLSALTVLVNAPFQGVTQGVLSGPELLLPALAAAVIARMENLPVAFWSGIGLGIMNAVVEFNVQQAAVTDVALTVVVLGALLIRRKSTGRGREEASFFSSSAVARPIPEVLRRLPEIRIGKAVVYGAVTLLVMLVPIVTGPGTTLEYTTALIFGMVAVSLVVLSGWGGTVSLGQFAFAGAGGIVAADLILKANVDLFQCLAVAAVVGAVLAAVVGLPAFRIRGEFLAVTTLAFAVCANSFFFNPTNFNSLIPGTFERPVLLGHINLNSGEALYYLCLAILVGIVLFVVGLRRARIGRALLAVRDNTESAAAMGVPTVRVRLSAFMLAGGISGLAGALYLVTLRSAGVGTFDPSFSLLIFSMAVIGGLGSIPGALTGVALVQAATYSFPQYQELMAGIFLLVILMVLPGGLGEGIQRVRDLLLRIVARRHSLDVPSLSTTTTTKVVELADDTAPTLVPGLHELVAEADEGAPDVVHHGVGYHHHHHHHHHHRARCTRPGLPGH